MIIGYMNNPHKDLFSEVKWIKNNFDFIDLTLESPRAHPDNIAAKNLKALVGEAKTMGHTGWYLPIGSPFPEMRLHAIREFEKCLKLFSKIGTEYVNVHFDTSLPFIKERHILDSNIWTLKKLVPLGRKYGIKVMLENTPGTGSNPKILGMVFKKVPKLLFHLDVAHAHIGNPAQPTLLMKKFSKRIVHMHICDNNGKEDLHAGLGKGNINWLKTIKSIKSIYDGTITLEVFNKTDALASKDRLSRIWGKI